jgi:hypothetical protein
MSKHERQNVSGMRFALEHGRKMRERGDLTSDQFEDLRRYVAKAALEANVGFDDMESYRQMRDSGALDEARKFAGTEPGERPAAANGRRAGVFRKVVSSFVGDAVDAGKIDESEALRTLANYVKIPERETPFEALIDLQTGALDPKGKIDAPPVTPAWLKPIEEVSEAEAAKWRSQNPTNRLTEGTAFTPAGEHPMRVEGGITHTPEPTSND